MRHDAVIDVSVETLQSIARLETSWKELEARANSLILFVLALDRNLATASPGGRATTRSSRSDVKQDRWLSDYLPAEGVEFRAACAGALAPQ